MLTIRNEFLTVTIDELGAQLMSITSADGTDYLWNGDAAYWRNRAPNLFPYVGRLTNDSYTYGGKTYAMTRHGFANRSLFTLTGRGPDYVTLLLTNSAETKEIYPWDFDFYVGYSLEETTLSVNYLVCNKDTKTMYFGLGAHPGFRVPLEAGKSFTDYRLTFAQPCQPWQVLMSENYMISGQEVPYPLQDGRVMPLRHDLFDHDAIILKNMDRTVTLSAGEGTRGVTVSYPEMRYLGVWHKPESDAPFVCLEPWLSLPSREGVVEDFSQQNDLVPLGPGGVYMTEWTATMF